MVESADPDAPVAPGSRRGTGFEGFAASRRGRSKRWPIPAVVAQCVGPARIAPRWKRLPIGDWDLYIIAPVAILMMLLPISINGIGGRESIFGFLLTQWGAGAAEGAAPAWLDYRLFLVMGLVGGMLFALRRR